VFAAREVRKGGASENDRGRSPQGRRRTSPATLPLRAEPAALRIADWTGRRERTCRAGSKTVAPVHVPREQTSVQSIAAIAAISTF